MGAKYRSSIPEDVIPLTSSHFNEDEEDGDGEEDLDSRGLITNSAASSSTSIPENNNPTNTPLITGQPSPPVELLRQRSFSTSPSITPNFTDSPLAYLRYHFSRFWRTIPLSWSIERDPTIAFRHVSTLILFISLCVFVFSVPLLLYLVSPRAPTPPGTSPPLDEAASTVSGKQGAVAADVQQCSELGVRVLRDLGGNAIDASISTILCQGVLAPFASGLGGGCLILVHVKDHPDDLGITRFYDARETAPGQVQMESFKSNSSLSKNGGLSIAIPGELKGLYKLHTDFGKLPWKDVVMPVVEIAENAKVGKYLAIKLKEMNETIINSPSLSKIFTKKVLTKQGQNAADAAASAELPGVRRNINGSIVHIDNITRESILRLQMSKTINNSIVTRSKVTPKSGDAGESKNKTNKHDKSKKPSPTPSLVNDGGTNGGGNVNVNESYVIDVLKEGDDLKNDALVGTLRAIAHHGPDALYHNLSDRLASEIQLAGGVATGRDFRSYGVKVREVTQSTYQGFTILGASPPSSGGSIIAMALNMITELEFRKKGRNVVSFRLLTECLKWVFGAAMGLADPSYIMGSMHQMRRMLSRREAMRRAYRIDPDRTYQPSKYSPGISTSELESGTSHISIIDKNGTAVSLTSSINMPFGSKILSSSSGIIFNNNMDAFTTSISRFNSFDMYPTTENSVQPGKRPSTSMCPTIVMRGRRVYLVLGGSSGPKSITGVIQTLLNVIDFGDSLADAINAPRLHHQLVPNLVSFEAVNVTTCEVTDELKRPSDSSNSANTAGWSYWGSVCEGLKSSGHNLTGPDTQGAVQAVIVPGALTDDVDDDTIFAASDYRRIGKAAAF